MFNFEKLDVWHKVVDFADQVYALTRTFPENERFGLTNQMRRAAGSIFEVVSQASISKRQGFLSETAFAKLYAVAEELSKMLSGLKKSLNSQLKTLN